MVLTAPSFHYARRSDCRIIPKDVLSLSRSRWRCSPSALSPVAGLPSQSERIFHRAFPHGATVKRTNLANEAIPSNELFRSIPTVSPNHRLPFQQRLGLIDFNDQVWKAELSDSKSRIKPPSYVIGKTVMR